jgi:tetratricopeptide (TPR) repeat protein
MKKLVAPVLFFFFIVFSSSAQSNAEKAAKLHDEAISLMDEKGDYDGAIKLLEQATKIEPANSGHKYEIAFAYYNQKKFDRAKDILKDIIKKNDASFRYYQLLGNIYDVQGEPDKAISTYKSGLNKWPDDGHLYNEMGIVELGRKNYNAAVEYWEKGLQVDPAFSSNYYWASKMYCSSDKKIWGIFYGELFMNLERNTKRTAEISKLLYNTYKKCVIIGDQSAEVKFVDQNVMYVDSKDKDPKIPFSVHYETGMSLSAIPLVLEKKKDYGMDEISKMRSDFIEKWYDKDLPQKYPNIVLDWQKKLADKKYLDCYNHWLMMKGDEDQFDAWHSKNKDLYDEFLKWFKDNPMKVDKDNSFYRSQYN